ncbi:hypothetical protein Godav_004385 [Gossypium davidsonii]|uniref:Uncharacterized protein n=2 Tax=Gossypium TaxID=3633 RepID=A0A7J8SLJ8_GOSDV|nr:hypothetical protein [Gossypium davidsonii]MBA0662397.1 hypothetical protein [Gossypium klotzschianum]
MFVKSTPTSRFNLPVCSSSPSPPHKLHNNPNSTSFSSSDLLLFETESMILYLPCTTLYQTPLLSNPRNLQQLAKTQTSFSPANKLSIARKLVTRGCRNSQGGEGEKKTERRSFLSLEEAGLVEISGLSSHEKFLCRLTISSLNLLRVISEQEGCSIEEMNAGRVCDWFVKDKLKREQNIDSAVLQWDESEFPF